MTLLNKLLRRQPKDPYWARFINGPIFDPRNDAADTYRTAPPGSVFPTKSEIPGPPRMAQDLAEFAAFMGALAFAAAATDANFLRPVDGSDARALAEAHPFTLVAAVPAEADPDRSPGVGGQQPRRVSALVNHAVASYIRELGYNAIVCPVDAATAVASAGLRRPSKAYVGDAVLTDIPVAPGPREM